MLELRQYHLRLAGHIITSGSSTSMQCVVSSWMLLRKVCFIEKLTNEVNLYLTVDAFLYSQGSGECWYCDQRWEFSTNIQNTQGIFEHNEMLMIKITIAR